MKQSGFALIEMLVVVLIIGILAGLCWPSYQFAVEKSRATEYITLGYEIARAQQRYYMANAKFTDDINDLDISYHGFREATATGGERAYVYDKKNIAVLPLNRQNEVEVKSLVTSNSERMAFRFHLGLETTFGRYKAGVVSCQVTDERGDLGRRICDTFCNGAPYDYTPQRRCIVGTF